MVLSRVERDIVMFSLLTRLIFLSISILARRLVPIHEADAFVCAAAVDTRNGTVWDSLAMTLVGGLTSWDAQHFHHISLNGYIYEQSLAFFPLYPGSVNLLFRLLSTSVGAGVFGDYSSVAIASFCLNTVCFTLSSVVLFRLSNVVLKSPSVSFRCALLFCISPASIFFLAGYSESLYSLLVFTAMLKYATGNLFYSAIFFFLASCCRSNGAINVGFILHYSFYLLRVRGALRTAVKPASKSIFVLLRNVLYCCLIVTPYVIFQLYGYYKFCLDKSVADIGAVEINHAISHGFKLPDAPTPWCHYALPMPYSYVQSRYWNVGFLKYYSFKQIPNFILAAPLTVVILPYCVGFLKRNRYLFLNPKGIYNCNVKTDGEFLPGSTFVYTVHCLFLILFCLLNINVQVTTRLICSSSPLVYWVSALYFKRVKYSKIYNNFLSRCVSVLHPVDTTGNRIRLYYLSYTFVGIVLFSCRYPWT